MSPILHVTEVDRERVLRCVRALVDPSPSWGRTVDVIRLNLRPDGEIVVQQSMYRRIPDALASRRIVIEARDLDDDGAGLRRKVLAAIDTMR